MTKTEAKKLVLKEAEKEILSNLRETQIAMGTHISRVARLFKRLI